tara:strand:+ start:488 stop:838 length:351 start_codon:yes stop_codon:yes gene_type:complete
MKNVKNAHMGTHLLVEVYNVPFEKLNNAKELANRMVSAVKTEKYSLLNCFVHEFQPQGVTVNVTLAESHFSLHTWPEKQCVAFDIFTCGNKNPRSLAWWMLNYLDSDDYEMRDFAR